MGERKMMQRERKQGRRKKVETPHRKNRRWWCYAFPRPNLPFETTNSLMVKESIGGSGGVTKSWRSSPSPCLLLSTSAAAAYPPQLVERNVPSVEKPEYWYYGYSDWDFTIPFKSVKCSAVKVHHSASGDNWTVPAFEFRRDQYYRRYYYDIGTVPRGRKMKDCKVIDPYSSSSDHPYMEFTNFISFEGKYFAISRQGCLAIIAKNSTGDFEITALGSNRVVPSKPSRLFREFLLHYKGEIFVVFLISWRGGSSVNVVDDVEILRLDKSRLAFRKVEKLEDDTMFFLEDKYCMAFSASLIGCHNGGNCVYFTTTTAHDDGNEGESHTWFVYDLKTGCISPTNGPEIDPYH
ncbi:unnamed protein product [Cuscuta epithymum]|uniref:KIB1-4 beta-propeller domain-containing protein n=1 Tax=Cuscuta epithymum TaxID=186058 RepID=A0AAV0BV40_9ASTE|nr:unnamed protein product [Cuscuta epithymum]